MRVRIVTTLDGDAETLFDRLTDVRAHLAVFPGVVTGGRLSPAGELNYRYMGVVPLVSTLTKVDRSDLSVIESSTGALASSTQWRLRPVGPGRTEVTIQSEFGPDGRLGGVLSRLPGPAFKLAARRLARLDEKALDRIAPMAAGPAGTVAASQG